MITRGQILAGAFEPIGIADYVFDITPEEQATAFAALDDMMAEWAADGVVLGYTAGGAGPNRADVMTTPDWADGAIKRNLAVRLAPGFGKTTSGELRRAAKQGYNVARGRTLAIARAQAGPAVVRGGAR